MEQVTTLDGEFQILERRWPDRDGMHLHADALAEHAARVAHATRFIDHIGNGRALDDFVAVEPAVRRPSARRSSRYSSETSAPSSDMAARAVTLCGAPQLTERRTLWHPQIREIFCRRHGLADRFFHILELVTVPDLIPRVSRSAAPITRRFAGSARPMRQTVFDEPTSRAATRPVR